ncbi:MAG: RidA family protein [Candidatus Hodarchaeota archaeon]
MTERINVGSPVGPYSSGIKGGGCVYVSGQGPIDVNNPGPPPDNIKDQTTIVLNNIKAIVEAAGSNVSKIVKTTVFLSDIKNFSKMNMAYKKFFKENGVTENFPARTTVQAAALPVENMLVEIDAIALL